MSKCLFWWNVSNVASLSADHKSSSKRSESIARALPIAFAVKRGENVKQFIKEFIADRLKLFRV